MGEEMAAQFSAAASKLKSDPSLRVVVITGSGKAFSGGGNLDMLEAKTRISPAENERLMMEFYRSFLSVQEIEVPVIAAINGHAMGAGLCLALACDIRIASEDAKLGLNFVHLGLHPGMGSTYFVPRLLGDARAAELLYTGATVSAAEGARLGLVNRVVPHGDFPAAVDELTGQVLRGGPRAIRELKASLRALRGASLEECLRREAACQAGDYAGSEFREGIAAAREKRAAKF